MPNQAPPISISPVLTKPYSRVKLYHLVQNIFGSLSELRLRNKSINQDVANHVTYSCYLSQLEPNKVDEALQGEHWVTAMHEQLHQLHKNEVWELAPSPQNTNFIGTKWIFKNKSNENGVILRNKAIFVT